MSVTPNNGIGRAGGLLDGRVALVTGGTRGIGRAIAAGFLREGANVVINGRSAETGRATISEWGVDRERVHFIAADVLDRRQCDRLIDEAAERWGRLHVLVNNAGSMVRNPSPEAFVPVHLQTDDAMEFGWTSNVMSAFWCSRRALPHLFEAEYGRIINISSIVGKIAAPLVAPYVVGKHALNGLTKVIAAETGTKGVTCNAICAGALETDMMRAEGPSVAAASGISYDQFRQGMRDGALIRRMLEPDEISAVATMLASAAGGAITGQCLNVDGGVVLAG